MARELAAAIRPGTMNAATNRSVRRSLHNRVLQAILPEPDLEAFRQRSLPLLCSAGLGGLPQISIPIADVGGVPLGLSLIGPAGRDRALIDLAATILAEG